MPKLEIMLTVRRSLLLLATVLTWQGACLAADRNVLDITFQKARLSQTIKLAEKFGINTSKYTMALNNVEYDKDARKHRDETVAKLQALTQELIQKMDDKERPPEGPKTHVGLSLGFAGTQAPGPDKLNDYLQAKVSAETPLTIKGLSGSALSSGKFTIGDRLLGIDGNNIDGLTVGQVLDKLQGTANTAVNITFQGSTPNTPVKTIRLIRNSKIVMEPL
jgi:C-terminal processing protease CtpA/Prc